MLSAYHSQEASSGIAAAPSQRTLSIRARPCSQPTPSPPHPPHKSARPPQQRQRSKCNIQQPAACSWPPCPCAAGRVRHPYPERAQARASAAAGSRRRTHACQKKVSGKVSHPPTVRCITSFIPSRGSQPTRATRQRMHCWVIDSHFRRSTELLQAVILTMFFRRTGRLREACRRQHVSTCPFFFASWVEWWNVCVRLAWMRVTTLNRQELMWHYPSPSVYDVTCTIVYRDSGLRIATPRVRHK